VERYLWSSNHLELSLSVAVSLWENVFLLAYIVDIEFLVLIPRGASLRADDDYRYEDDGDNDDDDEDDKDDG
jgi:hypothetical protein